MLLVETDQVAAELGLEYIRNDEDRSRDLEAGELGDGRQLPAIGHHLVAVAAVLLEGEDGANAQGRVEHHPEAADRNRAAARQDIARQSAVETPDRTVEIPEMADARHDLLRTHLGLVRRIDAYAEQGELVVVEEGTVLLLEGRQGRAADLIRSHAVEAQDDVAPGDRIEAEIRIAGRVLLEPGNRVADLENAVGGLDIGGGAGIGHENGSVGHTLSM